MPSAGPRPHERLSVAERDVQYNARATVGDITPIMARYAEGSRVARQTLQCVTDLHYGPHPDETLDVFPAASAGSPVFVFIHGGYWRLLSKDDSSFMAPAFVAAGATVVAINYQLAPAASLDEIVRQCRSALAWVHAHIAEYNGNPASIHVSGSSAGGHLTGMLLADDWQASFGVPIDVVQSASPISGLFDLAPLIDTHINSWAKLDAEAAQRLSPQFHLPARGCPLIVSHAETDTDEFKRQSRDYLAAWLQRGHEGRYVEMPGSNHFEIILALNDPAAPLTRAIFDAMSIGW